MIPAVVPAVEVCSLPGVPGVGCALRDALIGPAGAVGGAVTGPVTGAAGSLLSGMLGSLADGFFNMWWLTQAKVLTMWVNSPTPSPADLLAPGATRGWVAWLTQFALIVSLMIAAGRTVLTRDGRSLADVGRTVVLTLLVSALAVGVASALIRTGDAISRHLLTASLIEGFRSDPQPWAAAAATLGGPNGMVLLGIVGFLVSIVQFFLLLSRNAILPVVIVLLPLVAATGGSQMGRAWFSRLAAWLLALALYKPVAALIYAIVLVQARTADTAVAVLTAMAGMVLAVLTLPALIKLLSPATAGGGGGQGIYAAGMAAGAAARAIPTKG